MVKGGSRGDWGSAGGTRTPRLRVGHGRPSKKGGARSQESRVYLWVGEGTGNMRSPVAGSTAGLADGQLQGARRESGVPPPTNPCNFDVTILYINCYVAINYVLRDH